MNTGDKEKFDNGRLIKGVPIEPRFAASPWGAWWYEWDDGTRTIEDESGRQELCFACAQTSENTIDNMCPKCMCDTCNLALGRGEEERCDECLGESYTDSDDDD